MSSAVALEVDAQGAAQTAALVARLVQIGVAVDHRRFKEQQLATALKSADGVRVGRVTVQESFDVQAQLGHVGILTRVGAQEEAFGRRQAKTKVVGPVGRQREATVHVQIKARQADVQRQVQPGAHNAPAQVHVKADRIDTASGQGHARFPG